MKNNGMATLIVVIITAAITFLLSYIGLKIWADAYILQNGIIYSDETTQDDRAKIIANLVGNYNIASGDKAYSSTALQQKVQKVQAIIDKDFLYEYEEDELIDGAVSGMLASLDDPYAQYYNKTAFQQFYTQTEGEYTGIGIYVAFDKVKNMPIVLLPLEGSPALEQDIRTGDYIEYVNDFYSLENTYEDIIDAIKGIEGTAVKIGIIRTNEDGKEEQLEKIVTRKKITINPIKSTIYDDNIGYIKLTSFDETAYDGFKSFYDELTSNPKVKGLIIDLRDNPGGVLDICTKITDLIVPTGKIVYTIDKQGREEAIYSDSVSIQMPLVVLVNGNSASASEVFTAAVKDYNSGLIVGKTTYGKGVVQTLKSLKDGTYLKLTTQEYYSPNGNKINELGVTPDIEVDLPEGINNSYNLDFDKDTQLQRAIEEIKKEI